jgi:aldose 1-epimerase
MASIVREMVGRFHVGLRMTYSFGCRGMCADRLMKKDSRRMTWARVILMTMTIATTSAVSQASVTKAPFGTATDGTPVEIYTITSGTTEVRIMTYGARVVSLKVPDKDGKVGDVVLGFNKVEDYEADKSAYFGAVVGRYGNRIAKGKFSLDGHDYQITLNNNGNTLHGGTVGFDQAVWKAHELPDGVEFTLVSKDGDQGYPGTLTAHAKYTLHGATLRIDYSATTDKATVVNLTNHSYFNLSGDGNGDILHDVLTIHADKYTPVDAGLIPTGDMTPVAGTPFDFRTSTVIGARIDQPDEQLKRAGGYDHNWILNGPNGVDKLAAKLYDPKSGRVLTVTTTEPGVQFYTGNSIGGPLHGKGGATYVKNSGLCLETQHYPDSPNHAAFPTTELKPGEVMHTTTVFKFGVE